MFKIANIFKFTWLMFFFNYKLMITIEENRNNILFTYPIFYKIQNPNVSVNKNYA